MGELREAIRASLERHISESGYSQKEIAEKLGVSKSSVTKANRNRFTVCQVNYKSVVLQRIHARRHDLTHALPKYYLRLFT